MTWWIVRDVEDARLASDCRLSSSSALVKAPCTQTPVDAQLGPERFAQCRDLATFDDQPALNGAHLSFGNDRRKSLAWLALSQSATDFEGLLSTSQVQTAGGSLAGKEAWPVSSALIAPDVTASSCGATGSPFGGVPGRDGSIMHPWSHAGYPLNMGFDTQGCELTGAGLPRRLLHGFPAARLGSAVGSSFLG